MALGIYDLDDEDDIQVVTPEESVEEVIEEPIQQQLNSENNDLIVDYLKTKGIDDYSKIKFEDDNGDIIEKNWNDLSREEQFNILNTPLDLPQQQLNSSVESLLTNEEIDFINQLRSNNLTPQLFVERMQGEPQGPVYKVDDLSDDEVYLLDLESRVGELSDEEAAQALANAKVNEDFFKKLIDGIRKEYKEREDFESQLELATIEEQLRALYEEHKNNIIDSINNFNSIGNLDLNFDNDDKQLLAEFILSQDESGNNYLWLALNDPETLTRAAWFILNGEEAFNDVAEYFTNLIKLVSEAQYRKGLEDGKKGMAPKKTVFIDKNEKVNKQTLIPNEDGKFSIDLLDDDEE